MALMSREVDVFNAILDLVQRRMELEGQVTALKEELNRKEKERQVQKEMTGIQAVSESDLKGLMEGIAKVMFVMRPGNADFNMFWKDLGFEVNTSGYDKGQPTGFRVVKNFHL